MSGKRNNIFIAKLREENIQQEVGENDQFGGMNEDSVGMGLRAFLARVEEGKYGHKMIFKSKKKETQKSYIVR